MITQVYEVVELRLADEGGAPVSVNGALYSDDDKATVAMHAWVRENVENVKRYWDPEKVSWICNPTHRPYAVFVNPKEVL